MPPRSGGPAFSARCRCCCWPGSAGSPRRPCMRRFRKPARRRRPSNRPAAPAGSCSPAARSACSSGSRSSSCAPWPAIPKGAGVAPTTTKCLREPSARDEVLKGDYKLLLVIPRATVTLIPMAFVGLLVIRWWSLASDGAPLALAAVALALALWSGVVGHLSALALRQGMPWVLFAVLLIGVLGAAGWTENHRVPTFDCAAFRPFAGRHVDGGDGGRSRAADRLARRRRVDAGRRPLEGVGQARHG